MGKRDMAITRVLGGREMKKARTERVLRLIEKKDWSKIDGDTK